ncbi:MAG TPA: polyprenyl synthetase family protein [Solirubrobacteraceae bacterium]|nr:polyprenyl synthetase family protein [Solirubrobacteraceae bacterium]
MSAAEELLAERDAATVETILHRGGERLRARMAATEACIETVLRTVATPLATYASETILAGGKRLRPLLVMIAAEALPATERVAAGQAPAPGPASAGQPRSEGTESALTRAAVAVELIHSATLVHDDLIDGASIRRGRPTVAVRGGKAAAIATGDVLFSRAFAELARNGDASQLKTLSDASTALAAGEFLQREDAYAERVTVERYLRRCELKTASLFEAACTLGTLVVAPGERGLAAALGSFARSIGLAFQLLDDVLDVSGQERATGKGRGRDLLDGTVTLPLILARECDPELAELDLRTLRGPDDAERLCERIAATGALAEARAWALDVVGKAKSQLPADLDDRALALLALLADAVVERTR